MLLPAASPARARDTRCRSPVPRDHDVAPPTRPSAAHRPQTGASAQRRLRAWQGCWGGCLRVPTPPKGSSSRQRLQKLPARVDTNPSSSGPSQSGPAATWPSRRAGHSNKIDQPYALEGWVYYVPILYLYAVLLCSLELASSHCLQFALMTKVRGVDYRRPIPKGCWMGHGCRPTPSASPSCACRSCQ